MYVPVKYNSSTTLYTILLTRGRADAYINPTIVAGDVQISKDGGAFANLTNLPTVSPAGGSQVQIVLTATEASCKIGMIRFKDQTSPPDWEEQTIVFYTYGTVSAYDTRDFTTQQALVNATWDETLLVSNHDVTNSAGQRFRRIYDSRVLAYNTAQTATANTITLAVTESSTNGVYNNCRITIVSGTGAGQTRNIINYNSSTKIVTVAADWVTVPDATSVYEVESFATTSLSLNETLMLTNGTAQQATINTIRLAVGFSTITDVYKGAIIKIYSGTGVGQVRSITAYNGATGDVTVDRDWITNPDSTSRYTIFAFDAQISAGDFTLGAINSNVIAANAITSTQIAANAITSTQIAANAITSTQIAANAISNTQIANGAITSAKFAADSIDSNAIASSAVTEIASGVLANTANKLVTDSMGRVTVVPAESLILTSGQVQLATVNTLRLAVGFPTTNDIYKGAVIRLYSGTGVGQVRSIIGYNGTTGDITIDRNWVVTPDNTSLYSIIAVDSQISAGDFTNGAIDSNVIAANAIGNTQIADAAISSNKFSPSAITSSILAANAITSSQIAANAIGNTQIANSAISNTKFAANAIDSTVIAANAITSSQIAANAIGNTQIANAAISSSKFAVDAIDSNTLATTAVNEITAAILTNPTNKLTTDANGYVTLVDGSLTNTKFATNAITSSTLAANAITSSQIAANAIGNTQIANAAISNTKFATDAIDANALATTAVNEIAAAILVVPANKLVTDTVGRVSNYPAETLVLTSGQAQTGGINTLRLTVGFPTTNDIYKGAVIRLYSGTGSGQVRSIIGYNGTTGDILIDRNWVVNPDNTTLYSIIAVDSQISAGDFTNGAIDSNAIAANAIGNTQIANAAISNTKFATDAIDANALSLSGITEIASGILQNTSNKLNTDSLGSVILSDNSITSAKFATGAITSNVIAANAITANAIAANAIGNTQIANAAISSSKFATDAVDANALATTAVNEIAAAILITPTNKIVTDSSGRVSNYPAETLVLTSGQAQSGGNNILQLAPGFATNDDLYKGAAIRLYAGTGAGQVRSIIAYDGSTGNVTVNRNWVVNPNATTFYSIVAIDEEIDSGNFGAGAITSNAIAANAITSTQIAANAIGNVQIANAAISNVKFAVDAIDSNALANTAVNEIVSAILVTPANKLATDTNGYVTLVDNSLTNSKIANAAISASKFATDAIDSNAIAASAVNEIAITTTDQVWDEQRSAHVLTGSFGQGVNTESLNTVAQSQVNTQVDQALVDYDGPTRTDLTGILNEIAEDITAVSDKIGSPISLSGGTATISGMLTNMADDAGGASFSSTYNSLAKLVTAGVNVQLIADTVWNTTSSVHNIDDTFGKRVNEIRSNVGDAISLDGGTASLSGMLTKMADDNNGLDFDATYDSQRSISLLEQSFVAKPQVASSGIVNTGTVITGSYVNTNFDDGNYFRITPTGSAPINLDLFFSIPVDNSLVRLLIKGYYSAPEPAESKWVDVYIKNNVTGIFDRLSGSVSRMNPITNEVDYSYYLLDEHLLNGNQVNIRFISNDTNVASNLYLDYVTIETVGHVVANNVPGEIAQAVWQTQFAAVDQFSAAGFLRNSGNIAYTEIISVTSNTTFKVKSAPPTNTTWNDHILIYRNISANSTECSPIQSADTEGNVVLYRPLSVVPKIGDPILVGVEIWVKGMSTSTIQSISNDVWDELRSAHTAVGSFGEGIASIQGNITGNVQGNIIGSIGSLSTQAKADVLQQDITALTNYDAPNRTNLATVENNIRGVDGDSLKTLSDQLDSVQTTVNGVSNVTRLTVSLPAYMTRPAAGSRALKIEVALKDEHGLMEDPDTNQLTLQVYDSVGNDFNIYLYKDQTFTASADLGTAPFTQFRKLVRSTTGIYFAYFRLDSTSTETELVFKFGWQENGSALYEYRGSQISDAANDITSIMSTVSGIKIQTDKMRFDVANRIEADAEAISSSTVAADAVKANISNLNATISSRSTLNSNDVATAAANAILQTPANKLKTDVSGRIEVSGTKNKLDSLNDITVSDILNGVVDAKTVQQTLEVLLAYVQGKIQKTGSSYTYYKQDNTTALFTLTATPSNRTRS